MKNLLSIFTLLLLVSFLYGQQNDAALWPGIKLSHNFSHKLSSTLFVQERIDDNIKRHSNLFFDLSVQYCFMKYFSADMAYVFVKAVNLDRSLSTQHQFYTDLNFKIKLLRKLKFRYMGMFQVQLTDIYSSKTGEVPEYYIRDKFMLQYALNKKVDPYVFIEFRDQLYRDIPGSLNRIRYEFGLDYKLNKHNFITPYYLIQEAVQVKDPKTSYIIGFNFEHIL